MKQVVKPVKSKGVVLSEVTVNLPETCAEGSEVLGEARALACMHYGITVNAMNTARASATGGPKSMVKMISDALRSDPEKARKVAKVLGIELPEG